VVVGRRGAQHHRIRLLIRPADSFGVVCLSIPTPPCMRRVLLCAPPSDREPALEIVALRDQEMQQNCDLNRGVV